MKRMMTIGALAVLWAGAAGPAMGQSSSLYTQNLQQPANPWPAQQQQQAQQQAPQQQGTATPQPAEMVQQAGAPQAQPAPAGQGPAAQAQQPAGNPQVATAPMDAEHQLNGNIAGSSFTAVRVPAPRQFGVHDLVTIIIRESMEADFRSRLQTERDVEFSGDIADLPLIEDATLEDLHPRLGLDYNHEFDGEGDYRRSESIVGRAQARIIDIKPNGNLVLEARKHLSSDGEEMTLVLTGTARVEDITADNTVLSSELYDLNLVKDSDGELRRTSRKGIITRALETIFAF